MWIQGRIGLFLLLLFLNLLPANVGFNYLNYVIFFNNNCFLKEEFEEQIKDKKKKMYV